MNSAVDPLLEGLALTHPLGHRISELYENLQAIQTSLPSDKTFYRARDELLSRGYIEPIEEGSEIYRITEDGLDYLEGEITSIQLD